MENSVMQKVFGGETMEKVANAKVLMVGAGGIGCELLKNLVQSGFNNIQVIDLDTIDISNLNRQFLFRRKHVDEGKAEIAKESAQAFMPGTNIEAYKANIKEPKYDSAFFQSFDIVLNALDNLSARKHINRKCMNTGTPLVESGTQGYVGQIQPIRPKESECFECTEKQEQRQQYPVCTIRSYIDKPVHAIVWAKMLFALLFGPSDDGNVLKDYLDQIGAVGSRGDKFGEEVFEKIMFEELNSQIEMGKFEGKSKIPTPFHLKDALANKEQPNSDPNKPISHQIPSLSQSTKYFLELTQRLSSHPDCGTLMFDKDFEDSMRFVSAAANIRMQQFNIRSQSFFDNKGVAGNIVHAIATTNAIVSAAMVMETIKILTGQFAACRTGYIYNTTSQKVWGGTPLQPPADGCPICGRSVRFLTLDFNTWTIRRLRAMLQQRCAFVQPDMVFEASSIAAGSNCIDGDEEGMEEYGDCVLSDKKVGCVPGHDVKLRVDGFFQENTVMRFELRHFELCDVEYPEEFILETTFKPTDDLKKKASKDVEVNEPNRSNSGEKRTLEEKDEPAKKKAKMGSED